MLISPSTIVFLLIEPHGAVFFRCEIFLPFCVQNIGLSIYRLLCFVHALGLYLWGAGSIRRNTVVEHCNYRPRPLCNDPIQSGFSMRQLPDASRCVPNSYLATVAPIKCLTPQGMRCVCVHVSIGLSTSEPANTCSKIKVLCYSKSGGCQRLRNFHSD